MHSITSTLLKRCAMAAVVLASSAFAASGDGSGPAPSFTLTNLTGQPGGLGQYKGQVVMVNFWATWCGPCQQEMPLLDQMYKKYKPAGFTLIGVNVDKESPAVKELLARKPVSFPVLLDPANQVSKAYHVDEMPSSVIIDRKGQIRYIHRGYKPGDENDYQDRIRQLIRE
ncbi:MAG TPA: TlpA disulfide reductase family protein [Steroidobacteraceae bacterium]|jgi:peroxiredoxin|nr:TlpA disulfide reductase family protein [Steroidobacteraceae bacterium]